MIKIRAKGGIDSKLYADAVVESGISLVFYTPDAPNIDKLVEFMSGFLDHLMKEHG
jgi:hypothetical protein